MKILFVDMGSFTYADIKDAFLNRGYDVASLYYSFPNKYEDEFFLERLELELSRHKYDAIFSVNFWPLIAIVARDKGVKYISWSYDSPLEERLSDFFAYETNSIFLFDRTEADGYRKSGHSNVYHLPLAVNVARVDALKMPDNMARFSSDISFMGSLYSSSLLDILAFSDDYTKGYVEALMQVQLELYGTNLVNQVINDDLVKRVNDGCNKMGQNAAILTKKGLSFAISKHLTNLERTLLLEELSGHFGVKYYGLDGASLSDKVSKSGPVKYFTEMNYVFRGSRLNLCPTLRAITSGIPLRSLDVLAAGGALFSNYQPELLEYFADGEDVIVYESLEDALCKAEYYLTNDDLRKQIAINGHEKVTTLFKYEDRIDEMIRVVFG